ncbi:hypothetical protein PRZ48_011474 [Zasmidium cellare]|uniref:Vps41 beta-propeller domain-containing protein n=1 Tax=Zasmidium cellare TaxID=395010 RepID=A0ABR0E6N4_ZASCE|nr:hypothetical protein PRZ48_011474 [Zasmidium cellare]
MSADVHATEPDESDRPQNHDTTAESSAAAPTTDDGDEDDEEEEEEDEPKLKYAKLSDKLVSVYKASTHGNSTSAFSVAGDKMVVGTHNGSVYVFGIPAMDSIRTYRAHSATVTSTSISPVPPPPVLIRSDTGNATLLPSPPPSHKGIAAPTRTPTSTSSPRNPQQSQQNQVPNTPNNQIYIATSSLDGHVCISSLIDPQDVQLRNFARPVNAVALSPEYKTDKTYLSGGLAGNLVLTVGGKAGVSTDANTNSAAAAASGWLGAIGLGGNTGRDTSLHSGEGTISTVKWSLSGKWVVWVNEEGIKIMRSHLKLSSEHEEDAWRRIAHAGRPHRTGWEEMAGVWKARCEWVDEKTLESDDLTTGGTHHATNGVNGTDTVKSTASKQGKKKIEKLVVGWGDTAWVMHVQSGSSTPQPPNAKRQVGSADIIHKLQFRDCIVSGINFYTPSLLAILAYRTRDDNDKPIQAPSTSKVSKGDGKGRKVLHTSLAPQLRLVNMVTGEEDELDELSNLAQYEKLTSQDYHLGTLFMPPPLPEKATKEQQKGRLEGLWDVTASTLTGGGYATRMFSSSASVMSGSSGGKETNGKSFSFRRPGSDLDITPSPEIRRRPVDAHPYMLEPGLKLFIHSPYDCVLAVKRELSDHLEWLLEHQQYGQAWKLIDEHPEAVDGSSTEQSQYSSTPSSPSKDGARGLADFFADETASQSTDAALRAHNSAASKEKRRIGDLWLQQLVSASQWDEAGVVAGKVLGTSSRWEHWVWTFAQADKFDEITPYIPSTAMKPPLPSLVYEVILGHYIGKDRDRLSKLLDQWDPELFDVKSVVSAIEDRLDSGEVTEESIEDGVKGRDWRILMEALARLYLADGRAREALRCYIALQDAEKAFGLIREEKLLDVIIDDVPGLLMLRVSREQMRSAPLSELEEATSEAIQLLVEEAHRGAIHVSTVVNQLLRKGDAHQPFLFFYLRALWNGKSSSAAPAPRRRRDAAVIDEGHALVEEHADLAVRLFAEYDRPLLLEFLKASEVYSYDRAAKICKDRHYIPELVHILSKTGQTKEALSLIIGELGDVGQAIAFAKEHPDLWEDLLDYSMNKPSFIRGLLEEVGAARYEGFDPIDVVRRIPEGVIIEGLKQGIQRLVREFEIQMSISEGVAKVLRGEVGMGMDTLRAGRKKGVSFEVVHESANEIDLAVHDPPTKLPGDEELPLPTKKADKKEAKQEIKPGHCVGCGDVFHEEEKEPLIGFACGHVYHLSCLLNANPDTRDSEEAEALLDQMGKGSEEDGYGGRSVGGKVAHAHVIKNVVKGGCVVCEEVEGS